MALAGIPIPETQCIGDSLDTINNAFQALDTAVTAAAGANGTVTNVTGTLPISVTNGTTTPSITIAAATTSAAGSMSSADKTRLDDASGVNGIVQCNGSGDFSAASVVTKITAGTNISISPTGGTGNVTINAEGGATVTVQDTPPAGAQPGDLWFDSSSGVTSVYYDGTWVDVGGGDSGTSAGSVNGIVKSDGSGNFSAAVAGTDYLTSATLGSSPAAAKAWVTISDRRTTGTGTPLPVVLDSYNVSSIQLVAAQPYGGQVAYQINFTNSFVDTNYIICALVDNDMESDPTSPNGDFLVGISRKQTNNCAVRVSDWANAQSGIRCNMIDVIIFGQ